MGRDAWIMRNVGLNMKIIWYLFTYNELDGIARFAISSSARSHHSKHVRKVFSSEE